MQWFVYMHHVFLFALPMLSVFNVSVCLLMLINSVCFFCKSIMLFFKQIKCSGLCTCTMCFFCFFCTYACFNVSVVFSK